MGRRDTAARPPSRVRSWQYVVLALVVLYLAVPVLATLRFALTVGGHFSLRPLHSLVTRPEVLASLGRSALLAVLTVVVALAVTLPTLVVATLRMPRLRPVLETLTLLPFVVPGVILSLGLFSLYGGPPFALTGTPVILVCSYVILALPLMYRSLDNALTAIDAPRLCEAAASLGAGFGTTLLRVLVPNLLPGVVVGSLLTFATAFGEFTLANLLVGAAWKTFPVFMREIPDGHEQSGVAVISFALTWIVSAAVLWATGRAGATTVTGATR
jgi:putative spermidine/putrescine transport system permease protein